MSTIRGAWLFTRPGFENEGGQEFVDQAARRRVYGRFTPLTGLGLAYCEGVDWTIPLASLVFARDGILELGRVEPLPERDRVGALLEALGELKPVRRWGELVVHVPPGTQDRDLTTFARKWTAPAAQALRTRRWLTASRSPDAPRLDLLLLDFQRLVIAESHAGQRASAPGGRPRLRLPRDAPSRSTLKLEEAFLILMSQAERDRLLAPGMRAVDLGAAPGGWTYELVRRGMRVTAVDNGPMDPTLLGSEQVRHLQADGFAWLPEAPVDWMVCDIVDKPARTIELVGRWLRGGHCRMSVVNLKLPMKRRLAAWYACRDRLADVLQASGSGYDIRAKQLYHDREEVTVVVLPQ